MSWYKFTESILDGKSVNVCNFGDVLRGFIHINHFVGGLLKAIKAIPIVSSSKSSNTSAPYKIYRK